MNSKPFLVAVVLLLGVFTAGGLALQRYNASLRGRVADFAGPVKSVNPLREENARLKHLLERMSQDSAAAESVMEAELMHARAELQELASRPPAVDPRAQAAAKLDANRDPEAAPMRLEYFQNVGRATPGAAFQTLLWGATTGANETLAESVAISGAARQKLEAFIAGLPEETRAKYQTPEKLVSLFMTADILKSTAAQIKGQSLTDPQHAKVRVQIGDTPRDAEIPMELVAGGWRLVASEGQVDKLIARLRGTPATR